MDEATDRLEAVTNAVERILKAAGDNVPARVYATFEWEDNRTEDYCELVPRIEITWQAPKPVTVSEQPAAQQV